VPTTPHDQVALVTGAGHGIGRAIAVRLARAGSRVAVIARTESELAGTVAEAAADSAAAPVLAVAADVTQDAGLEHAVRLIIERLGRITVLVNNAGYAPPHGTLLKTSLGDWDRTLATCLRAPMVLTRLVLPDMLAHAHGTVINIASFAAKQGRAGETAYAAAKSGLVGFTQSLADEVRPHGIKVAAIVYGPVDSEPAPADAPGARPGLLQPADIADAVFIVVTTPARACPSEIVLAPQRDPRP